MFFLTDSNLFCIIVSHPVQDGLGNRLWYLRVCGLPGGLGIDEYKPQKFYFQNSMGKFEQIIF